MPSIVALKGNRTRFRNQLDKVSRGTNVLIATAYDVYDLAEWTDYLQLIEDKCEGLAECLAKVEDANDLLATAYGDVGQAGDEEKFQTALAQ